MPKYTVKSGDTLSGIASKLGLGSYNKLSGYRSGNPNLIYPGEVLTYGGTSGGGGGSKPKPKPSGPSPAQKAGKQANKYQKQADRLFGDLNAFEKAAKSPLDIYNSALESLGIADARTRVSSLREQLINTENMLKNVDENVTGRTADALVTESQRQKLVQNERQPIAEQLATMGQNFNLAQSDYSTLLGEGQTQAELAYQGQRDKRQGIIDRLEIAKDNARTAEDKRRWEKEISLQKKKMAEDKRRFEKEFAEDRRQFNANYALKKASASAGSGGGSSRSRSSGSRSSSGSSSSGKLTQKDAKNEFLGYIKGQWKKAGGAGKYGASRQEQDAWANAWFANKGITEPEDRQFYWDAFNSAYNRPENPYDDWLYKR